MRKAITTSSLRWLCLCIALATALSVQAAFLRNVPQVVTQPDGSVLHCLASGDEFYNYLHDADGYTIMEDHATGWYVYADESAGALVPTSLVPGRDDPKAGGLRPGARISPDLYQARRLRMEYGSPAHPEDISPGPTSGVLNNLVVFIRFSDDSEYTDTVASYDDMFNNSAAGANSMKAYYQAASYGQLTIDTTFYPVAPGNTVLSYQDSHPRSYYQPFDAFTNPGGYTNDNDARIREHTLLGNAVSSVASQVPADLNLDIDGDGKVDNVCFVVKGSPGAWSDLLWPHMWSLYSVDAEINGKRVWTYNFQLQTTLVTSGVGVLCHEMFHSLGAPDLYHYNQDGYEPVYKWDIMEYDLNPPQHMGAYMKMRYGNWIASIPSITATGTYTLSPITSATDNAYKIASPNSSSEYFVLEYRKKAAAGFESGIPGSGLLVYRINTTADGQGNSGYPNPPDEVYIYRPGGTRTSDGAPAQAFFTSDAGRAAIDDSTDPACWLWDGGSGGPGGLLISQVGAAGATISFRVEIPGSCTYPGSPAGLTATSAGLNQIQLSWSAGSPPGITYSVYRASSSCAQASTFTQIASGLTDTAYTDSGLAGGVTYAYEVTGVDTSGQCASPFSDCAEATATGACTSPPVFAGALSATTPGASTCTLDVTWAAATPVCTGPVRYDVYRSTSASFAPGPSTLVAAQLTGTSYQDTTDLASGVTHYYIVRAEDLSNGVQDANLLTVAGAPYGLGAPSDWMDDVESGAPGWTHAAAMGTDDWAIGTASSHSPTHAWSSADADVVTDKSLVAPAKNLTAASVLTFWHTFSFEPDFDGAVLEISTDGGTTWADLGSQIAVGGYTATLPDAFGNPLGGRQAWTNDLPWSQVTVNLAPFAGKSALVRWRMGTDESNLSPVLPWVIDDIQITSVSALGPCQTASGCTPPGPPQGLTAVPAGAGVVLLAWVPGAPSGATYNLYRADGTCDVPGAYARIGTGIAAASFTDTSLTGGSSYAYKVSAVDATGQCESDVSACAAATAPALLACTASGTPLQGPAPLTVALQASVAGGVPPYTFTWTLGNGATSSDQNPSTTYPAAGTYAITLTVADSAGQSATDAHLSVTASAPLQAAATAEPTSGPPPLDVTFACTATGGAPPYTYAWTLGDGTTTAAAAPSHSYLSAGDYPVAVTVTDSLGHASTDSHLTIHVATPPPPPVVTSMKKAPAPTPFTIVVKGSNLQPGIEVRINGNLWSTVIWKSALKIKIGSGKALKALVPKGATTQIALTNPDGGTVTVPFTW